MNYMKNTLLIIFGFLLSVNSFAQGYDIRLDIEGLDGADELILAHHWGDKKYSKDTSEYINGSFHFIGDEPLESGVYMVVTPKRNYFEIIVSKDEDQTKYYFKSDSNLNLANMVTKGSKENEIFFDFNKFVVEKGNEIKVLNDALKASPGEKESEALKEQIRDARNAMTAKRDKLGNDHNDLFVGKLYKAMEDVKIPDPPADLADSLKRQFSYYYFRTHYWDNFDLSEDGLVRTPIFHQKLHDYFDKYIIPLPDTSLMLADELINKIEQAGSRDQYKYTIHFLLKYYQESKHMCFDKALYHIVNNYYCSGKAFWIDSAFQQEMCEQAGKMAPTLCDLVAPDMNMPDSTFTINSRHRLSETTTPVTIVIFWDINCGHCKKEIPVIQEFWDSCNKEEVTIYAVYTQGDWAGWKKFIREKNLTFLNVSNAFGEDDFRDDYNIISTPQIYVLDKDHKIRFKKIGAHDLPQVVDAVLQEQTDSGS